MPNHHTTEDLLTLADQALTTGNYQLASKYFENYADLMMSVDKEQAAVYFSTAGKYEKVDFQRALNLYQKAFKSYKQTGKVEESASVLMEIGLLYLTLGKTDVARKQFKIGTTIYLEMVRDHIHNLGGPLTQAEHDYLMESLDKVKLCFHQLFLKESR
jgi:TolA-binding protein